MIKIKTILNNIYNYLSSLIHKTNKTNCDNLFNNHISADNVVLSANGPKNLLEKTKRPNLNENVMQRTKKELINWIASFGCTHFLTVQFPDNMKTSNINISNKHLKNIMAKFEYKLLGNYWKKKHLFFMAFAENGKNEGFHYHILLKSYNVTTNKLQTALNKTEKDLKLPSYTFCLEEIDNNKNKLYSYCIKEIKIKNNGVFSLDNVISSKELFDFKIKTLHIKP